MSQKSRKWTCKQDLTVLRERTRVRHTLPGRSGSTAILFVRELPPGLYKSGVSESVIPVLIVVLAVLIVPGRTTAQSTWRNLGPDVDVGISRDGVRYLTFAIST
jgi:hypothetical protein